MVVQFSLKENPDTLYSITLKYQKREGFYLFCPVTLPYEILSNGNKETFHCHLCKKEVSTRGYVCDYFLQHEIEIVKQILEFPSIRLRTLKIKPKIKFKKYNFN